RAPERSRRASCPARSARLCCCFLCTRRAPRSPLFPYTTLFRSQASMLLVVVLPWVPATASTHLPGRTRSEEHTSELQSRENLVCRLLLEKKKTPVETLPHILHK